MSWMTAASGQLVNLSHLVFIDTKIVDEAPHIHEKQGEAQLHLRQRWHVVGYYQPDIDKDTPYVKLWSAALVVIEDPTTAGQALAELARIRKIICDEEWLP